MARITSLTVFTFVTLVSYTLLATLFASFVYATPFENPYAGQTTDWQFYSQYQYSEVHNITFPSTTYYTTFSPDRRLIWENTLFTDNDKLWFARKDTWLGILWYNMAGSPITEQDIIDDFDTDINYSKYIFDQGGSFQTDVYIYPYTDANGTFIYYPINESITQGYLTVYMGVNNTTPTTFDIGILFGILTGFYYYGAPVVISIIIGGIWWILCLLTLVKLVIG